MAKSAKIKETEKAIDLARQKSGIRLAEAGKATRFKEGNTASVGIGRPSNDRSIKYYWVAMTHCSFEDWGLIVDRAVQDAKDGDRHARKWLGDYLMGPPVRRSEVTGKDGGPIQVANADLTEEQRMRRIAAMIEVALARRDENVINVTPDDNND